VGYALHALREDHGGVPWHRVINAAGRISARSAPGWDDVQQQLLEREGIRFDAGGRMDLDEHRWKPRPRVRTRTR
jgi:alkylated DNA nucleotide flippase Atl1